jgi:ribosomal-protein-alanine N-acetyltransferase
VELRRLATARLDLEALAPEHSADLFALWRAPEVCRFSGPACDAAGRPVTLPARTAADSDGILAFFLAAARTGRGCRWVARRRDDGAAVGALGFNAFDPIPELAFHQRPAYWGRGYMTEAADALLAWVAGRSDASVCEAFVDPDNTASIRLLARLGFEEQGIERDGARRWVRPLASA